MFQTTYIQKFHEKTTNEYYKKTVTIETLSYRNNCHLIAIAKQLHQKRKKDNKTYKLLSNSTLTRHRARRHKVIQYYNHKM